MLDLQRPYGESEALKLELLMTVSCHVDARNQTRVLGRAASALNN
ncbi:hypothetical protein LEMLEM_LOCUS6150 [Lemmus lemmus]